jgi:hypothetical protein
MLTMIRVTWSDDVLLTWINALALVRPRPDYWKKGRPYLDGIEYCHDSSGIAHSTLTGAIWLAQELRCANSGNA